MANFPFSDIQLTGPQQPRITTEPPLAQPGGFSGIPNLGDILFNINQPINFNDLPTLSTPEIDISGAQNILAPTGGIRPETQRILDIIEGRTATGTRTAASEAQALAARRGLSGSSIEQFGTAEAIGGVQEAARNAEATILLENLRQDEAARRSSAELEANKQFELARLTNQNELAQLEAEANRGNQQAQIELQQRLSSASAIQNELASLRNIDFAQTQLQLEQQIQERALQIQQENINVARETAERQAEVDILNNTIGIFGPSIAQKLFFDNQAVNLNQIPGVQVPAAFVQGGAGQGAGIFSNLFGGGSAAFNVVPAAPGTTAASSFIPGGSTTSLGAAQFAAPGLGSALGIAGAGLVGGLAGSAVFRPTQRGDALGTGLGSTIGTGIGAVFGGPVGAGIGSFIGAGVGKATSRQIQGISKLLRGEGTRTTKNIEREVKKGIKKIGQSLGFK